MFQLPEYQRLSEEQKKAYDLPINGIHLLIGPPGSGKTVVALYRSMMLNEAGEDFQLLVYTNVLNQYLNTTIESGKLDGNTSTFFRWFSKWYKTTFSEEPPMVDKFTFDWPAIGVKIPKVKRSLKKFPHILLDEAQDFSPNFFMVLPGLFENATVFADENQRIHEHNSTIEEIQEGLGIDKPLLLTKNFRNTYEIARFAAQFYTGLQSGIPDLPDRNGSLPRLLTGLNWKAQMAMMARYANNWRNKYIGIIVNTTKQVNAVYNSLHWQLKGPSIEMYYKEEPAHRFLDFTKPGIKIITSKSAKGLEFHTVFLPLLSDWPQGVIEDRQMEFYVLCSRAKEDLFLLTEKTSVPNFLERIPPDYYSLKI